MPGLLHPAPQRVGHHSDPRPDPQHHLVHRQRRDLPPWPRWPRRCARSRSSGGYFLGCWH